MIQRIQTVYLALAALLLVACCCFPLVSFEPEGMGFPAVMYSLVVLGGDGAITSYMPVLPFAVLAITEVVIVMAIFGYKNRRRQMKTCSAAMLLTVVWYAAFVGVAYMEKGEATLHPYMTICIPAIVGILISLAKHGIKKDDDLVRSADRIR